MRRPKCCRVWVGSSLREAINEKSNAGKKDQGDSQALGEVPSRCKAQGKPDDAKYCPSCKVNIPRPIHINHPLALSG